jgi:hypothetical protein
MRRDDLDFLRALPDEAARIAYLDTVEPNRSTCSIEDAARRIACALRAEGFDLLPMQFELERPRIRSVRGPCGPSIEN